MKTLNLKKTVLFVFALSFASGLSAGTTGPDSSEAQQIESKEKKPWRDPGDEPLGMTSAESLTGKVSLYPNPATGTSRLVLSDAVRPGEYSLSICDILGKSVQSGRLESQETVISLESLKPGLYFYTVSRDGNVHTTGRLIVN
jgi:hypothetical protein